MSETTGKVSPQQLLDAAMKKSMQTIEGEKELTKATADGVVQLLKLYKEYGGNEEEIPKKLRVIWLDEMKANDPGE